MCHHVFDYPLDTRENYNPDGKTLTGVCKYCGTEKKSYGMRWALPKVYVALTNFPGGAGQFEELDNAIIIC